MYRVDYYLGLLVGFFALILWYFSYLVIDKSIIPLHNNIFIQLLTIFGGSLAGAVTAFKLTTIKDEKLITKERVKSLNEAILLLVRQMNAVRSTNREIISNIFIENTKPFAVSATINTSLAYESKLDFNSISFLIEQNQLDLLLGLNDQQEYFNAMSKSIKRRDKYYIDSIVQVKKDNSIRFSPLTNNEKNELETLVALKVLLGKNTYHEARENYERMINDIDNCITTTGNVIKKLVMYSKKKYPKENFIDGIQMLDKINEKHGT